MTQRLLIIKTGSRVSSIPPEDGDFEDWILRGMGVEPQDALIVAVNEGEALPPVGDVGAAVVTGSPAMVTERASWSESSAAYLRELLAADVPVLGICYGHQLLAHALGGEVGDHPGGREMGTVPVQLSAEAAQDPLFHDLPTRFQAHTTHSQTVLRPPPDTQVLGANDFEPHQALRFGPRAWGLQFHPEFDAEVMRAYIRHRRDALAREGLQPESMLEGVRETPEAAELLRRFARLADLP